MGTEERERERRRDATMAFALLVASRAKAGASASHSALLGLTRKLSGLCPNAMKAAATIDLNRLTTNTATTTTRWSFYSSLQRTRQACVSGLFSISAAQAMRRSFQMTPSRHFTYDSDSERGYIPSRNSVETTFNFKPKDVPEETQTVASEVGVCAASESYQEEKHQGGRGEEAREEKRKVESSGKEERRVEGVHEFQS